MVSGLLHLFVPTLENRHVMFDHRSALVQVNQRGIAGVALKYRKVLREMVYQIVAHRNQFFQLRFELVKLLRPKRNAGRGPYPRRLESLWRRAFGTFGIFGLIVRLEYATSEIFGDLTERQVGNTANAFRQVGLDLFDSAALHHMAGNEVFGNQLILLQ